MCNFECNISCVILKDDVDQLYNSSLLENSSNIIISFKLYEWYQKAIILFYSTNFFPSSQQNHKNPDIGLTW